MAVGWDTHLRHISCVQHAPLSGCHQEQKILDPSLDDTPHPRRRRTTRRVSQSLRRVCLSFLLHGWTDSVPGTLHLLPASPLLVRLITSSISHLLFSWIIVRVFYNSMTLKTDAPQPSIWTFCVGNNIFCSQCYLIFLSTEYWTIINN